MTALGFAPAAEVRPPKVCEVPVPPIVGPEAAGKLTWHFQTISHLSQTLLVQKIEFFDSTIGAVTVFFTWPPSSQTNAPASMPNGSNRTWSAPPDVPNDGWVQVSIISGKILGSIFSTRVPDTYFP